MISLQIPQKPKVLEFLEMLCYDFYTFKTMILKVGHILRNLTVQNYFYHLLSELVKNRMGNFSISAEGRKRKPQNFKHPIS